MRGRGGGRTLARLGVLPAVAAAVIAAVVPACADDESAPERTIAFLRAVPTADDTAKEAFLDVLAEGGYVVDDNLTLLGDDAEESHPDPADAEATVRRWVDDGADLVVALSSGGARAAAAATDQVPILFLSNDPVATGLLEDERAPEANLTGTTFRVPGDRTLAVAAEAFGDLDRVGCLYPASDPSAEPARHDLARGAGALGIELVCESFEAATDVSAAVSTVLARDVRAVVLVNAPSTVRAFPELRAALAETKIPVVANTEADFAVMVLQPVVRELYHQLGRQALRLLDGDEVREVPVQDPGAFELVVNLQMAARVGIELPAAVVDEADRLID